ncbi:MAG: ribosome silencing factor [Ruminococcus sp.]|jgi:ribosome-associated protein|nr:ribosome silencing factor [Ruminococcus sp.]
MSDGLITAIKALDSKKGIDIRVIEIGKLSSLADYFVIVSGNSETQTRALADEVEFKLKEAGITPKNIQSDTGHTWIIMDYYDFIIHVFYKETREFYSLERLWRDGLDVDISDIVTP